MSAPYTFGDVRSLLQHTPSDEVFASLCEMLEVLDGPEVLAYAEASLQQWSPKVGRVWPGSWVRMLLEGRAPDAGRLCAHIDLSYHALEVWECEQARGQIEERGLWRGLESADFSGAELGDDAFCTLVPLFAGVKALMVPFCDLSAQSAQALAQARLPKLSYLELSSNSIGTPELELLSKAYPETMMELSDLHLGAEGARVLTRTPGWFGRDGAQMNEWGLGDEGVELLLSSEFVREWTQLTLTGEELGERAARALCACLQPWTRLNLSNNGWLDAAIEILASTTLLEHVRVLDLRDNHIGPAGAQALTASALGEHLEELWLGNNALLPGGARALASGHWPKLHTLDLSPNMIQAPGAQALASAAGFPSLRHLDLTYSEIGPDAALALVETYPELERLSVSGCHLGDRGAVGVLQGLRAPQRIDLASNQLTDEVAFEIARAPHLRSLKYLHLGSNQMTERGARALADAEHLSGLEVLELGGNPLGPQGRRLLKASPHLP